VLQSTAAFAAASPGVSWSIESGDLSGKFPSQGPRLEQLAWTYAARPLLQPRKPHMAVIAFEES
jgi:hypothetical protein